MLPTLQQQFPISTWQCHNVQRCIRKSFSQLIWPQHHQTPLGWPGTLNVSQALSPNLTKRPGHTSPENGSEVNSFQWNHRDHNRELLKPTWNRPWVSSQLASYSSWPSNPESIVTTSPSFKNPIYAKIRRLSLHFLVCDQALKYSCGWLGANPCSQVPNVCGKTWQKSGGCFSRCTLGFYTSRSVYSSWGVSLKSVKTVVECLLCHWRELLKENNPDVIVMSSWLFSFLAGLETLHF